jgi:hypothetical protein
MTNSRQVACLFTDIFTLTVNGVETLWGSFDMGGGGTSQALGPSGMSWTTTTNPGHGGSTHISLPISLFNNDLNTITFAYRTAYGPSQGLADEAWGIGGYSVTAVPEPESYAMLLAGLGIVGMMARRRRPT